MSIEENQKRKQTQLEFCFPDQKGIFSVLAERRRSIDSENKFFNDDFFTSRRFRGEQCANTRTRAALSWRTKSAARKE